MARNLGFAGLIRRTALTPYWLIDYLLFYVPLKDISLIWIRHHCRWRAAKYRLCSAFKAFEQGGIFIVPHLLWHGTSVFPVSSVPVRIRVRIDPPHPLVCRKRRLNGAVLRMRPEKPRKPIDWLIVRRFGSISATSRRRENRSPVSQQVWLDKDPSLFKGPERRA
jgi:hypothetical protein